MLLRCKPKAWRITELRRSGDGQHARFAPVGQRLLFWWTWIWLPSPCWGSAVAPGSPLLPFVPVPCLLALPSLPPGISVSGRTPALRSCQGCSWRLAVLAPQGLSLSVSLPAAFSVFTVSGSQRTFCPVPFPDCALGRHMSRVDALRQLAAQLSVLAALEDTIAVGFSSVIGPASPGRGAASPVSSSPLASAAPAASAASAPAPSPCHEVAASLLRSASLRASSPRTRTRSRSPAPLPKRAPQAPRRSSSVASGLRDSVALAESGLVTGLATKCCPPVPPPQLRLSRVARALHAASTESQPPAVAPGSSVPTAPAPEAPRVTEPSSNSDDTWDALLDAHGLTGTATAVAQPAAAAGASRRDRDKRRRRQRKASKPSMWRDI